MKERQKPKKKGTKINKTKTKKTKTITSRKGEREKDAVRLRMTKLMTKPQKQKPTLKKLPECGTEKNKSRTKSRTLRIQNPES